MPVADEICPFPPGSPEKIEWMAARVEAGFSPLNKADCTFDGQRPGCIQPDARQEVFALPRLRIRGVERDGKYWRARPFWLHKKHPLGAFLTQEGAEAVVRRFWIQTLGIFWMLGGRMGSYIVNVDAPDVPPQSPRPSGDKEPQRLLRRCRRGRRTGSRAKPLEKGGLFGSGKRATRLRIWREDVAA